MDSNLVYVDLYNSRACRTAAADPLTFPTLIAGGKVRYAFRFLDFEASQWIQNNDFVTQISTLRAAMGQIGVAPKSGGFSLQVVLPDSTSFTTAVIPWSCSDSSIALALNTAYSSLDAFCCRSTPIGFKVSRASGASFVIQEADNDLRPVSLFSWSDSQDAFGKWSYSFSFSVAPLVFANTSFQDMPGEPTISVIQQGGSDPSGTVLWNTIQQLNIPPVFQGTYQLTRNYAATSQLSNSDNATTVGAALNAILTPFGASATVTNPVDYICQIEFTGNLAGTNVPPLGVEIFSAPPADWFVTLDLGGAALWAALVSSPTNSVTVPFEVEALVYTDNTQTTTEVVKLFSTNITIVRPLILPDMAAATEIDWLDSIRRISYTPYTTDQVLTGNQQAVPFTIGDGSLVVFDCVHNLGQSPVPVLVCENSSGGRLLAPSEYTVHYTSDNSVEITGFATTPTAGQYQALVFGIGPASVFQAHTHTIEQIVGLWTWLTNLSAQVAYLLGLLPAGNAVAAASGLSDAVSTTPSFGEILPDLAQLDSDLSISSQVVVATNSSALVVVPSTPLQSQVQAAASTLAQITQAASVAAAAVANPSIMTIPFSLDKEIIGYQGPPLTPTAAGYAESLLPTVAVDLSNASNFERELWRVPVNDNLFSVGRKLQIDWGVALQLLRGNCLAEYLLVVELGAYSSDGSSLTAAWSGTPIFTQPLLLTKELATHSFGLTFVNSAAGISLTQQLYGSFSDQSAYAPSSANFVIRSRLCNLETQGGSPPLGFVSWGVVPSLSAAAGVTTAQAVITAH